MWFFYIYKSKVILYIGDQIKMFFKWKVFLFLSLSFFFFNGDKQFSFFLCAEEQLWLNLQELGVLFPMFKAFILAPPIFTFLNPTTRQRASWENNFYTLIWRKTLELYFNLHVPSARYRPEQPEVAKATILGTEPLHTNFWVGMFSFLMGMYRSREKTAELWSGYAELVFLPLPVLRWLLPLLMSTVWRWKYWLFPPLPSAGKLRPL